MQNSQIAQLFQTLNAKEKRELKKFLRSPFHNRREDVIQLFDYLLKHDSLTAVNKWEKKAVFTHLFPDEVFDRQRLYHVFSFLKKLIEEYLVYADFKNSKVQTELQTARIYRQRGLQQQYQESIKTIANQLKKRPLKDAQAHYERFQFFYEKAEFDSQQSRTEVGNLRRMSDELSIYFISQKLRQACQILSYQSFSQIEQEKVFLQEILKYTEQKNYHNDVPCIEVYYHYFQAFTEKEGEGIFQKLKSLVKKYHQQFPKQEMRNIYLMPINFGIKRFNHGERAYLQEVFELYQQGLEYDIFIENNRLSRFTYSNIALAGMGLKAFDWVEKFIHEYRQYLDIPYRENAFHFNLANLYFQQQDYQKTMNLLQKVEFDDVLYNLESRRMLLKVYYSLEETEALFSLLDSFKRFIHRQKKLGYHKESFLNLIRFTGRLLRLDFSKKTAVEKLKMEIENTSEVAEKKWLLSQLEV